MKKFIAIFAFLCVAQIGQAQFGAGFTATTGLYHLYQNPEVDDHGTAGAILNLGVGPKLWVGGNDFSISAEAQACAGLFAFSVTDYRGLGSLSFPMMVKLNFKGLSALDKEGRMGLSIGGGIQYSKTEALYKTNDFKGGTRDYFKTYIGQVGYGFGISGFTIHGFARYGWESETKAQTFNVGVQYDFNLPNLKNVTSPESSL